MIDTRLRYRGEEVVIVDVSWMDQDILTVPVPSQVKVATDEWTEWIDPNQIKVVHRD
jgi:hypothetical protein